MADPENSSDEDEQECGYVYDHDTETVDEESGQWVCRRCGAEGWDPDDES